MEWRGGALPQVWLRHFPVIIVSRGLGRCSPAIEPRGGATGITIAQMQRNTGGPLRCTPECVKAKRLTTLTSLVPTTNTHKKNSAAANLKKRNRVFSLPSPKRLAGNFTNQRRVLLRLLALPRADNLEFPTKESQVEENNWRSVTFHWH